MKLNSSSNSNLNVFINYSSDENISVTEEEWLRYFSIPFNGLLMIVDIWLLISLIHYGTKTGKWGKTQQNILERFNSGFIYISLIVCSISCFLLYLVGLIFLNSGSNLSDYACNIVFDIIQAMYFIGIVSSMLFLWFRQRAFYKTRFPGVQFNKILKIFSKYFIFIIFAVGIPLICVVIYIKDQASSEFGCVYRLDGNLRQKTFIATIVVVFILNFSLAFVFIYALKKIALKPTANMTFTIHTYNEIEKIIKKTTIFAVISFLFNTGTYVLALYLPQSNARIDYGYLLVTIDVTVNLCCVLLSFRSWKDMITSPVASLCH